MDVSSDMIEQGKKKFPDVQWLQGQAEALIPHIGGVDLFVFAQSFQWMDRVELLSLVSHQLHSGGVMGVIQNNRHFEVSGFLGDYESLLEAMSPNYSRYYRRFDFLKEITDACKATPEDIALHTLDWVMSMPSDAFIGMSRSSTQAQRAMAAHGEQFLTELMMLIKRYEVNGSLEVCYRSELYMYSK